MKAKGSKVTEAEKRKMWEYYKVLHSYSAVAKKMRRSRDTVAKYVHEYETSYRIAQILR